MLKKREFKFLWDGYMVGSANHATAGTSYGMSITGSLNARASATPDGVNIHAVTPTDYISHLSVLINTTAILTHRVFLYSSATGTSFWDGYAVSTPTGNTYNYIVDFPDLHIPITPKMGNIWVVHSPSGGNLRYATSFTGTYNSGGEFMDAPRYNSLSGATFSGRGWNVNYLTGGVYCEVVTPAASVFFHPEKPDHVWGVKEDGYQELASAWTTLPDIEKKSIFEAVVDLPTIADLSMFDKFQISQYYLEEATPTVIAVPNNKSVLPKGLIDILDILHINKINPLGTLAGTAGGKILFALTTDNLVYQVYRDNDWHVLDLNDFALEGMSRAELEALTSLEYDILLKGQSGIGIGYYFIQEKLEDALKLTGLDFNVDMRGCWDKAYHNSHYDYEYVSNRLLRVTFSQAGTYQVTYMPKEANLMG